MGKSAEELAREGNGEGSFWDPFLGLDHAYVDPSMYACLGSLTFVPAMGCDLACAQANVGDHSVPLKEGKEPFGEGIGCTPSGRAPFNEPRGTNPSKDPQGKGVQLCAYLVLVADWTTELADHLALTMLFAQGLGFGLEAWLANLIGLWGPLVTKGQPFVGKGEPRPVTWLILPVVICLSQRLSHACLRVTPVRGSLRMAH